MYCEHEGLSQVLLTRVCWVGPSAGGSEPYQEVVLGYYGCLLLVLTWQTPAMGMLV